MIKVALVEDNDLFRTALETIVSQEKDLTLAGSFTSAEKALSALEQYPPDIAIGRVALSINHSASTISLRVNEIFLTA